MCAPLLHLSVVMTAVASAPPASTCAAAWATQAALVAQAWAIIGPVMSGAPIRPAIQGAP